MPTATIRVQWNQEAVTELEEDQPHSNSVFKIVTSELLARFRQLDRRKSLMMDW